MGVCVVHVNVVGGGRYRNRDARVQKTLSRGWLLLTAVRERVKCLLQKDQEPEVQGAHLSNSSQRECDPKGGLKAEAATSTGLRFFVSVSVELGADATILKRER